MSWCALAYWPGFGGKDVMGSFLPTPGEALKAPIDAVRTVVDSGEDRDKRLRAAMGIGKHGPGTSLLMKDEET